MQVHRVKDSVYTSSLTSSHEMRGVGLPDGLCQRYVLERGCR
jgi:hypothetical protein